MTFTFTFILAAFRIIKGWLPEKAVQKIKFLSKKDIQEYIPSDQVLVSWGGKNDYTFSFVPEPDEDVVSATDTPIVTNRKVNLILLGN